MNGRINLLVTSVVASAVISAAMTYALVTTHDTEHNSSAKNDTSEPLATISTSAYQGQSEHKSRLHSNDTRNDVISAFDLADISSASTADEYGLDKQQPMLASDDGSETNKSTIKALLLQIDKTVNEYLPENVVFLESAFDKLLDENPDSLNGLVDAYLKLPESPNKEFLQSLLAGTRHPALEKQAVEQIITGMDTEDKHWLKLISDMGISHSDTRQKLLDHLPSISESADLAQAIHAIDADVVSASDRQLVINSLESHIHHNDASVRSAAIEKVGTWGSTAHIPIVETAMLDGDSRVRNAAISATRNSNMKSDSLRSTLLNIMKSEHEDWNLRVHAFHALKEFSLSGNEYDDLHQFKQRQKDQLRNSRSSNG